MDAFRLVTRWSCFAQSTFCSLFSWHCDWTESSHGAGWWVDLFPFCLWHSVSVCGGFVPLFVISVHGGFVSLFVFSAHGGFVSLFVVSEHGGFVPLFVFSAHGGFVPLFVVSAHGGFVPNFVVTVHGGSVPFFMCLVLLFVFCLFEVFDWSSYAFIFHRLIELAFSFSLWYVYICVLVLSYFVFVFGLVHVLFVLNLSPAGEIAFISFSSTFMFLLIKGLKENLTRTTKTYMCNILLHAALILCSFLSEPDCVCVCVWLLLLIAFI